MVVLSTGSSAIAETSAAVLVTFGQKWKMIFCGQYMSIIIVMDILSSTVLKLSQIAVQILDTLSPFGGGGLR